MANVKRKGSQLVSTSVSPGAPEGRPSAADPEGDPLRDGVQFPEPALRVWTLFNPAPSAADRETIGPDYMSYLDDETEGDRSPAEYVRRIGAGNAASYAEVLRAGAERRAERAAEGARKAGRP